MDLTTNVVEVQGSSHAFALHMTLAQPDIEVQKCRTSPQGVINFRWTQS